MSQEKEGVASFKEFSDTIIDRVKGLGYNCLQIMAIQEHAYYGSFGYHVTNFYGISSRFGSISDLKELIKKAHENNIIVILDIVLSHASKNSEDGIGDMDGTGYQYFHEGEKGIHSQWDSYIFNLNNLEVFRFLLSNIRFWIQELDFDGFRFDAITSLLYHHHGISYGFTGNYQEYFNGNLIIESLAFMTLCNALMKKIKPNAISIAEDVSGFPTLCRPIEKGGVGFDYRLNMYIPDMWVKFLEMKDEDWDIGHFTYSLNNKRALEKVMNYVESHD